jgi:cyclic beta-1,2-glucan synthetase
VAISLATGAHGLPLMGTGDWNDGMNLVGAEGQGESVWLAWFQLSILPSFAALAEARGDAARAAESRAHVERLRQSVEGAWDGRWYRRAYFDDGTPLGSRENQECRIDAIAQSWAVLSGAADPARARQAMESVEGQLIQREHWSLAAADASVRSNGTVTRLHSRLRPWRERERRQYTHAALWNVLALARLGDGDRAMECLRC